jgi:hypothetical protein
VSKLKRYAGEREKLLEEREKAKTSKVRRERIDKRLEVIKQCLREALLEMQIGAEARPDARRQAEGGAAPGRRRPARGCARWRQRSAIPPPRS